MPPATLLVRLVSNPGKEAEAAAFLRANSGVLAGETVTITWRGTLIKARVVYVFDDSPQTGLAEHAQERIADALLGHAPAFFAPEPPTV